MKKEFQQTNFTVTASGGVNYIYQWKVNGKKVGGNSKSYSNSFLQGQDLISCEVSSYQTNPSQIENFAFSKTIKMRGNSSYCNSSGSSTSRIDSGSEEGNNVINYYPNSASRSIIVDLKNVGGSNYTIIKIQSINGRIVKSISTSISINEIDISDLQDGVYIINIINDRVALSGKLIIQK